MIEYAQWGAIAVLFCAVGWLFVCVYSDRAWGRRLPTTPGGTQAVL